MKNESHPSDIFAWEDGSFEFREIVEDPDSFYAGPRTGYRVVGFETTEWLQFETQLSVRSELDDALGSYRKEILRWTKESRLNPTGCPPISGLVWSEMERIFEITVAKSMPSESLSIAELFQKMAASKMAGSDEGRAIFQAKASKMFDRVFLFAPGHPVSLIEKARRAATVDEEIRILQSIQASNGAQKDQIEKLLKAAQKRAIA